MTNADSAPTSNQNYNLMSAESANNAEDDDPISKNTATTIRNLHATSTPPLAQPSPSAQHPTQPSPAVQQTTMTASMITTTLSPHRALLVVGTSIVQPESCRGNHQIHHSRQHQQHHQALDPNVTSGNNPPAMSSLVSTTRTRKDEPNALDAEEAQTEVLKRIKEEVTSLALALQSMEIEWTEDLLSQKDFVQTKKMSLQN